MPTLVTLPRHDPRIEQIAEDPGEYYARARERALSEAREDFERELVARLSRGRWFPRRLRA